LKPADRSRPIRGSLTGSYSPAARVAGADHNGVDDVVVLLGDFIGQLSEEPGMLFGHSYGGCLARGIAAQRPGVVRGLALLCPVAERSGSVPGHEVVRQDADAYDELEAAQRAGFDEYFVVRTPATARRYRDYVVPGKALIDETALGRIFAGWRSTSDRARSWSLAPSLTSIWAFLTTCGLTRNATARMRPTAVVSPARGAQQVRGLTGQMTEAGLGRKIRHDVSFAGPRSARQAWLGRSP
jgi:pimeloyl-ACP methyl ester carboxylesterase